MKRLILQLLYLGLALASLSMISYADTLAIGVISYDVTSPGNSAQFDITNQTGPNSSVFPDTTFPVTTTVVLSSLSLVVNFSDGSTYTEPASYFTLSLDGISFEGSPIGIGGTTQPTGFTLTGSLSPTVVTLSDGSTRTILPTFSASIVPSGTTPLSDGDLAVIYATTATTTVPEPGFWMSFGTLMAGLGLVIGLRGRKSLLKATGLNRAVTPVLTAVVVCTLLSAAASAAVVSLNVATTPSSGATGTNINVTVKSGWPAADTTPGNVAVTWATACGGPVSATNFANTLKVILPGSERVNVTIPSSLTTGTYYLQVSDSAVGDTVITSGNCSAVAVTASSPTLAACVPASSLGIVAPVTGPAPVYAYVPRGAWGVATTGFSIVQVETGSGPAVAPVSIPTGANVINSCAGNPATKEAVCVSNGTNVYHVGPPPGNTVTPLVDGATFSASFSGGSCQTCGVAINSTTNQAVLAIGLAAAPSHSALQVLDLSAKTFQAPFPLANLVSENIVVDVPDSLVLSANEFNKFGAIQYDPSGHLTAEYSNFISAGGEMDATAVDCKTRIALVPLEFTSNVVLTDLSQAKYVPGSPGSWSAPTTVATLIAADSAGTSGAAVAPGVDDLAVVTGEFGGSAFQILKLPASGGSGGAAPALQDYANVPCITGFSAGYDPHTVTAYVSPNDGKSYTLFANWITSPPSLLRADMAAILALPRTADGHTVVGDSGSCLNPAGPVGSTVLKTIAGQ